MLGKKKKTEEAVVIDDDYSLRKAQEKKSRRKREKKAEQVANMLVPLALALPAPAKHCDVCGLRCDSIGALAASALDILPLGDKTKEEREAKERKRKEKGKKEKKGIHKDKDKRKAEKMAKKERKLLKKLAHDKQKEAERTLQAQHDADKNEMAALHALGAEERRALNLQIDVFYHQLHCSLEQLDCVARVCEARRVLTKFYGQYQRVLVDALSRQLLGAAQHIRLELRQLDAEEAEVLEADLDTFTLDLVSTVPPTALEERNMALELDALTTYLMQAVERQRHLYLRHDALWVSQHAQDVVFGAPDAVAAVKLVYVAAIQREYAFVYLPSLQDFYTGLRRAHDGKAVRVIPKTRGDAPREIHEEPLLRLHSEEEDEEDDGYEGYEESLSADTEESITDEEELLRQAAKTAPRNKGLSRDAKGHMTLEGKQRYIACPILRDPYGLGTLLALDSTTYLIALVRLAHLNDRLQEQQQDLLGPLEMSQYNAILNCFLFTTHVGNQAYYLEYLVDAAYNHMQNEVKLKRTVTDKKHKVRADDDEGEDEEDEREPKESNDDDDDESSDGGAGGGQMVVERKPEKQEIELYRVPESRKRSARLADDERFVDDFVTYLYNLVVTGSEDRDAGRSGWDPLVKTRAHKKSTNKMSLHVIFIEEARRILHQYDDFLGELAQSHLKEPTPRECVDMVDDVTTEMRMLKERGKEQFYVKRPTGERRLVLPARDKIMNRQGYLFGKGMLYLNLTRSLVRLLSESSVLPDYVLEAQYPYLLQLDEQGYEVECIGDGLLSVAVTKGGIGYTVDDVLTVTGGGGSGGRVLVETVSSDGGVTAITMDRPGRGYSTGKGRATKGGTGTGMTVNIVSVGEGDDDSDDSSDQLSDVEPRSADEDYTPVRIPPRNNNNNNNNNNNQATVESDDDAS